MFYENWFHSRNSCCGQFTENLQFMLICRLLFRLEAFYLNAKSGRCILLTPFRPSFFFFFALIWRHCDACFLGNLFSGLYLCIPRARDLNWTVRTMKKHNHAVLSNLSQEKRDLLCLIFLLGERSNLFDGSSFFDNGISLRLGEAEM